MVLNQVASERHERLVREAIAALGLPVVGALHRDPDMALPERHLGLVQAREHAALEAFIERLADVIERVARPRRDARAGRGRSPPAPARDGAALPPPGQRIAIAEDAAFSFVYPHVGAALARGGRRARAVLAARRRGARPDDCDACWLPGGYPELHAGRLAAAAAFRGGAAPLRRDRPVHGECGGFMVLGRALEDADGVTHPMAGLLGHVTSFAKRRMNLGYRQARLLADAPIGRAGAGGARPRVPLFAAGRARRRRAARRARPTARASRSGPPARGAAASPAPSSTPSPRR